MGDNASQVKNNTTMKCQHKTTRGINNGSMVLLHYRLKELFLTEDETWR